MRTPRFCRVLAATVVALLLGPLTACGGGDDATTSTGPAKSSPESEAEPDHVAALSADAFGDLCTGPIRDSLIAVAPDVWASEADDPADEVAVNVDDEEGSVACVWDGPDGSALYAEYKPLATVSDGLLAEPRATADDDLAAAGGTPAAYVLGKDEFDSYGAAWVSGDTAFVVSTDTDESTATLTTDDLSTIVRSLPVAGD